MPARPTEARLTQQVARGLREARFWGRGLIRHEVDFSASIPVMALTNSLFRRFFRSKGWRVPGVGEVFGVGLRGARLLDRDSIEVVPNVPGIQNDVLGFAGGEWYLAAGTVEPGNVPSPNPRGMAYRTDGVHEFRLGDHKGRPAFVQHGPARIWRDRDGDHRQDVLAEPVHTETGNGLNWHAGSVTQVVGGWSVGCLNTKGGWSGLPWKTTYSVGRLAIERADTQAVGVLAVYLMSAAELVAFSNRPAEGT